MTAKATTGLPGLWRRQPMLAVSALRWANRWRRAAWPRRGALVLLLAGVAIVAVSSLHEAWRWRVGLGNAVPWWLLVATFALWSALLARRHFRQAARAHQRGWMQAWPIEPRALQRWLAVVGSVAALLVVMWPAWMAGLTLSAPAPAAVGWNLAACLVGAGVGVGLASWPRVDIDPASRHAASALVSRSPRAARFLGLDQLRDWQRRAVGHLSLRRWAPWVLPVLLAAPSSVGVRGGVQILLLVLVWPLYARAMAASLHTITAAARLLAATPLPMHALWRQLLPRPLVLAALLAVVAAVDLSWLGASPALVIGIVVLLALLEGARIAHRCLQAGDLRMAVVRRGVPVIGRNAA